MLWLQYNHDSQGNQNCWWYWYYAFWVLTYNKHLAAAIFGNIYLVFFWQFSAVRMNRSTVIVLASVICIEQASDETYLDFTCNYWQDNRVTTTTDKKKLRITVEINKLLQRLWLTVWKTHQSLHCWMLVFSNITKETPIINNKSKVQIKVETDFPLPSYVFGWDEPWTSPNFRTSRNHPMCPSRLIDWHFFDETLPLAMITLNSYFLHSLGQQARKRWTFGCHDKNNKSFVYFTQKVTFCDESYGPKKG